MGPMGAGCVNLVMNVGGRNKHDSVSEWPRRWTRNPYIQASHACAPGSTPGGRIGLAAVREGVLLNKEFAPIWKHPALVGWEEWGKRQTGNGKGKHELAVFCH